jgi:hypothetical protein
LLARLARDSRSHAPHFANACLFELGENDSELGTLANFDPTQQYTWRFINTALGFSGVPIGDINFVIDDSQFAAANGIPTGRFSVIQDSPLSLALQFAPLLPGDFNYDDSVDAADYVVWRTNPGGIYTPNDYTIWRAHFGQTASSGSGSSAGAAIPEPASALLTLIGAAVGWWRRRRTLDTAINSSTREAHRRTTVSRCCS